MLQFLISSIVFMKKHNYHKVLLTMPVNSFQDLFRWNFLFLMKILIILSRHLTVEKIWSINSFLISSGSETASAVTLFIILWEGFWIRYFLFFRSLFLQQVSLMCNEMVHLHLKEWFWFFFFLIRFELVKHFFFRHLW